MRRAARRPPSELTYETRVARKKKSKHTKHVSSLNRRLINKEDSGFWEVLADLLVLCERRLRSRSYQGIREGDNAGVEIFRREGEEELFPVLKWGLEVRYGRRLLGPAINQWLCILRGFRTPLA